MMNCDVMIKIPIEPSSQKIYEMMEFCKEKQFEFTTIQLPGISVKTATSSEKHLFLKRDLEENNYTIPINNEKIDVKRHRVCSRNGAIYSFNLALGTGFIFTKSSDALFFKMKYLGDLK